MTPGEASIYVGVQIAWAVIFGLGKTAGWL